MSRIRMSAEEAEKLRSMIEREKKQELSREIRETIYMGISLKQMFEWHRQSSEAAIAEYFRHTDPQSDRVSLAEARRMLKNRGIPQVMLARWTDAGIIEPSRSGTGRNAAVWYSKSDILEVIASATLKKICNDQKK